MTASWWTYMKVKYQRLKTKDNISWNRRPLSLSLKIASSITKVDDGTPYLCVLWGFMLSKFYIDISWHADSIVQLHFEDTLQNLVKTTLHCINLRKYPFQIRLSEPSKGPSKIRNFFSFKFSKKAETCEPINVNVDAANFMSIGEMSSAVASSTEECWWDCSVGRKSMSFSTL